MTRLSRRASALLLVVISAIVPGRARAQDVVGYLGIDKLSCNCTFRTERDGSSRVFIFRSEPVVTGIASGSPAWGLLQIGDTIAQIDGLSLLTAEGARRFAAIRPNQDVTLSIRRGRIMRVSLVAREIDASDSRAMGVFTPQAGRVSGPDWYDYPATPPVPPGAVVAPAPRSPRPQRITRPPNATTVWGELAPGVVPAQPATPAAPVVPAQPGFGTGWAVTVPSSPATPRGWFGFSIRCSGCGWSGSGRPGETPVWESDTPPEITRVEAGSSAAQAGFRSGDRLTHVNGVSIVTAEGGRMLGGIRPGQTVRLTVLRNGASITRELKAQVRPEVIAARAAIAATAPRPPGTPAARRALRYTGKLDDVSIEVWSAAGPTVERIGDEMVITIGTTVVRLKAEQKR